MALKEYEVSYVDGTAPDVVAPTFADGVAFEAHLRAKPQLGKLQDNLILSTGYRCYAALHRTGRTALKWNDWMNAVADIELIENDEQQLEDDEYSVDAEGAIAGKSTPEAA